jgi:hypothetical protein
MNRTKADHALIAIKAAVNALPMIGGSIASLIGDYVPLSTQRSIQRTTEFLADRLATLEGRIDLEAVNKDEFAELFKSCYLTVVRTTQEVKLRAAASILANLLLHPQDAEKLSFTELDHLTRCLETLSIGAITVLVAAMQLVRKLRIRTDTEGNYRFTFGQLHDQLSTIEPSLFMGLVGELSTYNLLRIEGLPPIRTPEYGNHPLGLTPVGQRFVGLLLETGVEN